MALTLKEKLEEKKTNTTKAVKTDKTATKAVKTDKTATSAGRPKGVVYKITEDKQNEINESADAIDRTFNAFLDEVSKFTEKGNKSAAAVARKKLQEIAVICKSFRLVIQQAKDTMETIPKE